MLKKISAFIMAAMMVAGLSSCQMPQDIFTDQLGVSKKDSDKKISSAIYEFEFTIDGQNYYLPADFVYFLDRSWSMTDPNQEAVESAEEAEPVMLAPYEYTEYFNLYKDNYLISVKLYNDTEEEAPLEECRVAGISMDALSNVVPYLQMDGDIKFGDSYDSVVDQFGKPSFEKIYEKESGNLVSVNDVSFMPETDEDTGESNAESDESNAGPGESSAVDTIRQSCYYLNSHSFVEFTFDEISQHDDSVAKVVIENDTDPEEKYDFKEDLDDIPDVISLYDEPALLGTSINDFAFKYESNLYTLPVPVSELVDDGWEIVRGASKKVLVGYTADGIVIRKGNIFAEIKVHNYDTEKPQNVINCFAISISAGMTGTFADIMLPDGITLGSTEEDINTLYNLDEGSTTEDGEEAEVKLELSENDECIIYTYIYKDYVPTVPIPDYISKITDGNISLIGAHRKFMEIQVNKTNRKVVNVYLQNCPEYVLDEAKIWEDYVESQKDSEAA